MNDDMNQVNMNSTNTDPVLDSLLDEALSHEAIEGGVPAGLSDRVMQATADQLPSVLPSVLNTSPVIARIGSSRMLTLRRIAAVVILFAWVGATIIVVSIVRDAKTNLNNLATVENVIEHVAHSTSEVAVVAEDVEPIDNALDQLEVDIELAISSTTTSWEELAAEFEAELDMLDPTDPGA